MTAEILLAAAGVFVALAAIAWAGSSTQGQPHARWLGAAIALTAVAVLFLGAGLVAAVRGGGANASDGTHSPDGSPSPSGTTSVGTSSPTSPTSTMTTTKSTSGEDGAPSLPYRADWSTGMAGWAGSPEWAVVDAKLANSGSGYGTNVSITAPLMLSPDTDFAVRAKIQLVRNTDAGNISGLASFGIVVRAGPENGGLGAGRCVAAGIFTCGSDGGSRAVLWTADGADVLDSIAYDPGPAAHEYGVEVRGTELTVLIDGAPQLRAKDAANIAGTRVGLWSDRAQIEVLSFEVSPL